MKTLKPFLIIRAALILAAFVMAAVGCAEKPKGEAVFAQGGAVRIDVSALKNSEVRFYRYKTAGKAVRFFAAKSASGDIKTAFDACISCYTHRAGYRQEKGEVVCIHCGTPFGIDQLECGKGNCMPIKIEHWLEDHFLIIRQKDLEDGAKWF